MTKIVFTGLIFLTFLIACAGPELKRKSMSEDLGSTKKITILKKRANNFWSAFVQEDYKRVYDIYDPFFRARVDFQDFMGLSGKIKYHEYEIKGVMVEGNIGKVKVEVVFSLSKLMYKESEFSVPKTQKEFEETWLYIYDNWYKEWYLESLEDGYTDY